MRLFLRYLLTAFVCSIVLCGCGGDDPEPQPAPSPTPEKPTLTVTPQSIKAPIKGLEQVVTITTTASSWKISQPESQEWVRATITTGLKGESTTKIVVDENLGNYKRSATIIVTAPDCKEVKISISQACPSEDLFYGGPLHIEPDASKMGTLSSRELAVDMGLAWNLGNTLEAPDGETSWGNVLTTQQIISFVKSCGFKTIRVPVSWLVHRDDRYGEYHIRADWFTRVKEVIDYCLAVDMYVMINEHWDNGAFNSLTTAAREEVLKKAEVMWRQIAIHFRDYDHRLIFAGFNENTDTQTAETYETQNLLLERFVKTVRETGGRNAYRYLAVQAFNTNIDECVAYMRIPEDTVENRLLVECHLYTPWAFCGQEEYADWIGGEEYMYLWDMFLPSNRNNAYYKLSQIESELRKFGQWCEERGVGALLGEFAATYHGDLAEAKGALRSHQESRAWWHYNVARLCKEQGICPMLWDNGDVLTTKARGGFLDRANLKVADPAVINALKDGFEGKPFVFREE